MRLYLDRQNRRFVSDNYTPDWIEKFYQGDVVPVSVQVFDPSGSTYTIVSDPSSSVKLTLGVPGIYTSSVIAQNILNYDSSSFAYTGSLYLTSSTVSNYLGANASVDAYVEFEFSSSLNRKRTTIYQASTTLSSDLIK